MKTYSPDLVVVSIGLLVPIPGLSMPSGFALSNFSEDSQVEVDYREDSFQLYTGVDGQGTRVKTNDYSGTIKVSLMQSSDDNDKLGAIWLADRQNNGGLISVQVKDNSGRSLYIASQAFIQKAPTGKFHKKINANDWMFVTDVLVGSPAGNAD